MKVPIEVIQEIKNRLDIVSVIGEYIPGLKKAGRNWTGLCPFHNDHNPSLHISTDLGIFKCFSCNEGGDLVKFIQKIENTSFIDAIKFLAKKAGISLNLISNENSEISEKRDEFVYFNKRMINLFQYFLLERDEGKPALNYLDKRGIKKELIEAFKIGYAPKGYNRLSNFLIKKGYKEDFLILTGLFKHGETGLKPLFFDRIMFPIINQNEECVGFGGRVLNDEIKPKYINSPETLLYKKRYNLYGINAAKNFIREQKKAFIVEGYMDDISSFKNGVKNVVAPCGTALTKEQIALLARYADEIILLMDNDDAGLRGAEKALWEGININVKKSVLVLPIGKDPDDYFKSKSLEDFNELVQKRNDGFDYLVHFKTDKIEKNDYSKLIDVLNSIFEYINLSNNEVLQTSLLERLSELLNIEKGVIAREFLAYKNKRHIKQPIYDNDQKQAKKIDEILKREIDLLLLLLKIDEPDNIIKKCGLKEEHFTNELCQKIFKLNFNEFFSKNKKDLLDNIDDNDIKNYAESRLFSEEFQMSLPILKSNVIDRIKNIIKKYYIQLLNDLQKKVKLFEIYKDDESIKKLQEEKILITNEIQKLSKLSEYKK